MTDSRKQGRGGDPEAGAPNPKLKIMIIAGEASGDKHGAALARSLRQVYPGTEFELFGSGGDEMREAGVETLIDARDVAIIGIPEIARALGRLYRAYRKLLGEAQRRRPAAVVLIDWPDFNLRLARKLHRDGFKIVYYISPQVWAWRRYRTRAIRRDVDRMLVILPFEEEFYKSAGVEVEYVGHPLAEAVRPSATRDEFISRHELDPSRPIIALLPGSRRKEVHYHLPVMLDAAKRLGVAETLPAHQALNPESEISSPQFQIAIANRRDPQFVVPLATTIARGQVEAIIEEANVKRDIEIAIVERDTYNTLEYAEFAVVASGTATVEAALAGTPMVIIYRGSELNWHLIRPLIHLDTFGMVNLIAGRRIVPELMQADATGERIAAEVRAIVSDAARLSRMRRDLEEVRERLRAGGAEGAERAARAVMRAASQSRAIIGSHNG
ncbi:MAG TPA: lipid-A-disaccharide synthase [Blastocatellia bacterium]|jgi:lipid-A-disaccharide synthase